MLCITNRPWLFIPAFNYFYSSKQIIIIQIDQIFVEFLIFFGFNRSVSGLSKLFISGLSEKDDFEGQKRGERSCLKTEGENLL